VAAYAFFDMAAIGRPRPDAVRRRVFWTGRGVGDVSRCGTLCRARSMTRGRSRGGGVGPGGGQVFSTWWPPGGDLAARDRKSSTTTSGPGRSRRVGGVRSKGAEGVVGRQ
jgi:hypothetical protein